MVCRISQCPKSFIPVIVVPAAWTRKTVYSATQGRGPTGRNLLAKFRSLRLNQRSMENASEYLIVSASLKSRSRSRVVAEYLADCYRTESISPGLIDLKTMVLPLCDGEATYEHPDVGILSKTIAAARVILVATPIYNFDANAALKNLIELTGRSWENRVVGFICAAGSRLSYMSIMSLANSLMLDFRCLIIPHFVFATEHDFVGDELSSPEVKERIRKLVLVSTRIRYQ